MRRSRLLVSASSVAIMFCGYAYEPALGQTSAAGPASTTDTPATQVEQVVVSASRITLSGYSQPTPVTAVGVETLEREAKPDLISIFHDLPSFGGATSPETARNAEAISSGAAGVAQLNLRSLGTQRTLVLVNGVRMVSADITTPGVDLNTIPDVLIKRVDVVTGGASAAWGSDAVSGVVNLIMNNDFQGIKGNAGFSINQWGNKQQRSASLAYGTSFFSGKGHVVAGINWVDNPNNPLYSQASYYKPNGTTAIVPNPAYSAANGQPQYITVANAGISTATNGGLIVSSAAGTGGLNANVLRGIQFFGNGVPGPFNFGTTANGLSYGGSALSPAIEGQDAPLGTPVENISFYGRASYSILDNVTASLELNMGQSHVRNSSISYQPSVTIKAGNPYIPASVAQVMTADGIPSFVLGTTNLNNLAPLANPLGANGKLAGELTTAGTREFYRGVFALDGTIGDDWTWNTNAQHSVTHRITRVDNTIITSNYNNAVDAVLVTTGNVGASGLPLGSIQCRSTLTNPSNGCSPLNLFGEGVAAQSAINYVNPGPNSANTPTQILTLQEDTFSASIQGKPFSLWAGPVGVAVGFDYRKEAARQTANALALANGYAAGNFANFVGEYNTKEGFAEINAPLLRDNFVQSIDFDAAGRITDYSTSGMIETWKLGLVSQVNDDVRLRTSWSLDIRAPTVYELFNKGFFQIQASALPNGQTVNRLTSGNPALTPEVSTTISGGVVLTPTWVPGLTLSADWYSIDVKKAIFTPTPGQVYTQCQSGVAVYCSALVKDGAGVITEVLTVPLNAASTITDGLDFQGDYLTGLFSGNLALSLRGNYVSQLTTNSAVGIQDTAGSLIGDTGGGGMPKFRATVSATYTEGPWSGTVQTRLIGSAHINNNYHEGSGPGSIDNNSIPAIGYLDLRGSYFINDYIQLYTAIDNVIDTPPPLIPYGPTEIHPGFYILTNPDYYDTLGRTYRVGVRFRTD